MALYNFILAFEAIIEAYETFLEEFSLDHFMLFLLKILFDFESLITFKIVQLFILYHDVTFVLLIIV
jgi:hypothetical protein